MRKRRETQKGSLSSAQATGDNMSQKNNVAEQERMKDVMDKINNALDEENVDSLLKEFGDYLQQSNLDLLLRDAKNLFNGKSMVEVEAVCMTILFGIAVEHGEYNAIKTILNLRAMFGRAMKTAIKSVTLLTHE